MKTACTTSAVTRSTKAFERVFTTTQKANGTKT